MHIRQHRPLQFTVDQVSMHRNPTVCIQNYFEVRVNSLITEITTTRVFIARTSIRSPFYFHLAADRNNTSRRPPRAVASRKNMKNRVNSSCWCLIQRASFWGIPLTEPRAVCPEALTGCCLTARSERRQNKGFWSHPPQSRSRQALFPGWLRKTGSTKRSGLPVLQHQRAPKLRPV